MQKKLNAYNAKRDFTKTGEPKGRASKGGKTKKFVVQFHRARKDHYDFRLEWNGVLLSWAVPKGPSFNPQDKRLAVKVEDHPVEYADFEGLIPKGQYGGGSVMIWDEGEWEALEDFGKGLKAGSLKFLLRGKRLKGNWALVKMKNSEGENWLLIKEKDAFAKNTAGITGFTKSIRSGRTSAEIERGVSEAQTNPFTKIQVQLAELVDEPPAGNGWLFEIKYDGYRIVAYTEKGKTRLITRNGNDYTDKFRAVAESLSAWSDGRAMVFDGEMVIVAADGRTDFQALQHYVKKVDGRALTYMVFDLLALDGKDLRMLPLTERKKKLEGLLRFAPRNVRYSTHVVGKGRESFAAAAKLGLEGVIGKKVDSVYAGERNGDWVKVKCRQRQEFVVGGYTLSEKKAEGVSSLLLGVYKNEKLCYCGRAGTGISKETEKELQQAFSSLSRKTSPFSVPPKPQGGEKLYWVKPALVAEVEFAEVTKENLLRQASFKGLRTDKTAKSVGMEVAENKQKVPKDAGNIVRGIKISSPDKVVYKNPRITKLDVIHYYEAVSDRMLPHIVGRILSVVRCHSGVNQACFYKKHPSEKSEGVCVVSVTNGEGGDDEYFYIKNMQGLISQAQLGSLEFHVWGSPAETYEHPDRMVFDLDPDEGMPVERIRRGVRDLKSILDKLSLKSFLKTSGGKGYHVVVPFEPVSDWNAFRDFAEAVARLMAEKWPDRYTANVRKANRKGKIFIDWMRNGRGSTSVAPYSLRARPGAKVSMPISWKELDSVAPDDIDLSDALERLKKPDPWRGFFTIRQRLEK